jgi:DNA-directed RNA polymerase subunit RPC12/RpoP
VARESGEDGAGRFNELRTQYRCPHCGKRFPVGLEVFGLDVRMDVEETRRLLLEHVLAAPDEHSALFY